MWRIFVAPWDLEGEEILLVFKLDIQGHTGLEVRDIKESGKPRAEN